MEDREIVRMIINVWFGVCYALHFMVESEG